MLAAVYHGQGDIRVEQVPAPLALPGEVVIKVAAVGICGSDAHEFSAGPTQYPISVRHPVSGHLGPMIPGHEPAGQIVAVGTGVRGLREGDLVASGATTPCGECRNCRQGRGTICTRIMAVGVHRNGALAEFAAIPATTCRRLEPYGLHAEVGALAQPMAIGVHAVNRGRLRAGERALIIGAGGIGAFVTHVAARAGAHVTVVDRSADRLTLAQALGANETVPVPPGADTAEVVPAIMTDCVDVVYELTGSASGLRTALQLVTDGGRIVQVGFHHQPRDIDLFRVTLKELELIGTNSLLLFPDLHVALELLAARTQGWRDLAPELLPLDQLVVEGLAPLVAHTATRVKTLIDPFALEPRPLPV